MMIDEKQVNQENNLYLPSVLGLLLILAAAAVVWVGQFSPAVTEQAAAEPAVDVEPAAASVEAEQAPVQAIKGDFVAGQTLFTQTCSACHGPMGEGIQSLGKNLVTSDFVAGQTDEELLSFIKIGRGPTDPLNTTGIAMPPKGGNPALSEEDLQNIVTFMRSIHK